MHPFFYIKTFLKLSIFLFKLRLLQRINQLQEIYFTSTHMHRIRIQTISISFIHYSKQLSLILFHRHTMKKILLIKTFKS